MKRRDFTTLVANVLGAGAIIPLAPILLKPAPWDVTLTDIPTPDAGDMTAYLHHDDGTPEREQLHRAAGTVMNFLWDRLDELGTKVVLHPPKSALQDNWHSVRVALLGGADQYLHNGLVLQGAGRALADKMAQAGRPVATSSNQVGDGEVLCFRKGMAIRAIQTFDITLPSGGVVYDFDILWGVV